MNEVVVNVGKILCEASDLIWSMLISFIVAKVTLYWERKQTIRFRKEDVKIQYLKECMIWLNEVEMIAYDISDKVADCLCTSNINDFGKKYKSLNSGTNMLMEKCLVGISAYRAISKSTGIGIDFEELRGITGEYARNAREVGKTGFSSNSEELLNFVNENTEIYIKAIEERIAVVGELLVRLLDEK